MVTRDPISRDDEPMSSDGLARSADPYSRARPRETGTAVVPVRPLGGRRINFLAWGLAGVTGIALWALILRLA